MKIRHALIALPLLFGSAAAVQAQVQVGVGISLPGIHIGINMPSYPSLVLVPGYPVYYNPHASANYFFYDGMYWVYVDDNWYASSWYNGPWMLTAPEYVPIYVLRVPVRYYRHPPVYFRGWRPDAPPRWGDHWGRGWEERNRGWDRWDRKAAPRPAPLPIYQRQYSDERYPHTVEQQHNIRSEKYRYQPREAVTRQHYGQKARPEQARPEPRQQAPASQRQPVEQRQQPNRPPQQERPITPRPEHPAPPPRAERPQAEHPNQDRGGIREQQERGRDNRKDERRNDERGQDRR